MNALTRTRVVAGLTIGVLMLGTASVAPGQFLPGGGTDQNGTQLPPAGVYLTPDQVHATYTGGALQIVLSAIQHRPFVPGKTDPAEGGQSELETFNSDLHGNFQAFNNGVPIGSGTADATGPVQVLVHGKNASNQTGTFNTEMLSMTLSGNTSLGPVMIRESPTLASLGQTQITPNGGGSFHINSFFDVFTELSIDGGATWMPSSGSAHVNLVPEPGSLALCGLALMGMGLMAARRRRPA